MTAADLIRRAADAGVTMTLSDAGLQLDADRQPPDELLAELVAHKVEIIAVLSAANDPSSSHSWLHLLVLVNGHVIQQAGDRSTASVEQGARLRYGDDLLAVVAAPGFERPLTDAEIIKALAGTLAAPVPARPAAPSSVWLARVARLLGIRSVELLAHGYLDRDDLHGLAGADEAMVAHHIRHSPAWINRAPPTEQAVEQVVVAGDAEPQRAVRTAATAATAATAKRPAR